MQATSSFTISVSRDTFAPLSQLQFEALSFELSHVKYFSQVFPPLPRIRLNSRAHHPLDPDLASKVAKRLQNQIARRNGFTGSLWSCLLGVAEKHCTKKTQLSGCLSLSCNKFLSLVMTARWLDILGHWGETQEAKSNPLSRWCHRSRSKIWT